jgi:hypothetical protein
MVVTSWLIDCWSAMMIHPSRNTPKQIIWDVIVFTTKIWKKLPSSWMVFFFFFLHIRNVVGWFHCSGWANQNPKHQYWAQHMALRTARCLENLACAIGWALNNCNSLSFFSSDDDSSKLVYECNFRFQSFIMGSHFGWQFCLDNSMSIQFHICHFI